MPERAVDAEDTRQSAIDGLAQQVRELAGRVAALEDRIGLNPASLVPAPLAEARVPAIPPRIVPVAGHALLAIAGAYFLRALTEIGALPLAVGVAAGILYAVAWLALAARTPADRRLDAMLRALTAALVLAPLIWESTVRFRALPALAAAVVMASFTVVGLGVSWRKNLSAIAWIATLTGVLTSLALLLGTRDVLPFTLSLLALFAVAEASACLDHWRSQRWVAVAGADLAVLLLTILTARPVLPESYSPIPAAAAPVAQAALLAITLTSVVVRTLVRGLPIRGLDTAQFTAAFLIGVGGTVAAHGRTGASLWALPGFALVCGVACYGVWFALVDRQAPGRNLRTYAVFALLLTVAGSWTLMGANAPAAAWPAAGFLCSLFGARWNRPALRWHGLLYLLLAAVVSGVAIQAGNLVLGSATGLQSVPLAGWTALLAIALSYLATGRGGAPGERTLALSALLVWLLTGVAAGWLTGIVKGVDPESGSAYGATLRTAVLTLGSLALAGAGARWRKQELTWLVYPMMALCACKLVVRDLRESTTMALFLSILLFGGTLTALPRLLQRTRAR